MNRKARIAAHGVMHTVTTIRLLGMLLMLALAGPSVWAQSPDSNGTPLGMEPGSPEGSYALSGFENVNLYNGGLSFSLPLMQVGGRGGAGYSIQVPIDSKWMVSKNEWYDQNNVVYTSYVPTSSAGYLGSNYGPGTVSVRYNQWKPETCNIGAQYFTTYRWASVSVLFTAPDGTEHELVDQATLGQPTAYGWCALNGTFRGPVFVSRDQPGMTFISDAPIREAPYFGNGRITGYLKLPDGTVYRVDAIDHYFQHGSYFTTVISWLRDRNGNKTTFNYTYTPYGDRLTSIKDSLNRQITIEYGVTEAAPYGFCDRLTYKGFGGADRVVRVSRGALSTALRPGSAIQTYKQLFPELDGDETPFDPSHLTTAVWLPDGDGVTRRYRFLYNSYGELARVELPTGGASEYDWGAGLANGASNGLIHPVPNVAHWSEFDPTMMQVYRRLLTRRAYDAGNVLLGSTTYGRPETQNPDRSVNNLGYVGVSHLDANGQQLAVVNHYFYGSPATSFFSWQATPQYMPTYSPFASYRDGREYQTDYLAANGSTLLRRETQSWGQPPVSWWAGSQDAAPPNSPFVKETVMTLADTNQVTKTTNVHPQTGQVMIDQFGNPLDVWVYDYGAGQPGALLRHTHTEFLTINPVNSVDYTNRTSASAPHLLNLPTRISVYDGGGVERARTTMEYDNYAADAGHAGLVDCPNISGFEPSYNVNFKTRGQTTAVTRYLLTTGSVTGSVNGYTQYDIAGNVVKTIDARGFATTYDMSDRFGTPDGDARANGGAAELSAAGLTSYAFATSTTNALGHTTYLQFDYHTGKAVDAEDANGTTYSGFYADALDRPTQVISGANLDLSLRSRSIFNYDDVNRVNTRTSDFNSFAEAAPLKTQTVYDGVGRTTEARKYETASNYIATRTRYDALGRVSQSSNPFRNGESPVWTTTVYDELSRVRHVTTPDNSVSGNSYSGNSVTTTDQTGRKQRSVSDALGRVAKIYEDPDGANWLTDYTYDTLDDLTGVTQYDPASHVTQTRTFVYDSLKRLVSASNPERGTVTYVHDEQGNVLVQTDARGVSSHASYDALNRLTRRWSNGSASATAAVNNSPALPAGVAATDEVNHFYDSQALPSGSPPGFSRGAATGRLVAVAYGGASAGDYFGYDALGRANLKVQQTGGVNYQTTVTFNNGGAPKTLTYPSGHVVNYNYDQAGRLGDKDAQNLAMTGNLGDGATRTYSTGIAYSPLGAMSNEQYGTQTPVYNKSFYNVRGQLTEIRVATTPSDTFWNRGAIINHYSNLSWAESGSDNNGNLKRQDVYIPSDDAISAYSLTTLYYDYDGVNRLDKVREVRHGQDSWVQDYEYDRFGNRKLHPTNTWGVSATQFAVSPSNNRLGVPGGQPGAMSYDAVGNLTNDTYTGQGQRVYDAWNRMTQAWASNQWQTYTYDGSGRRVRRNVHGVETRQVYGFGGELLAEYAANPAPATPQKEYGYRGGELLVVAEAGPGGSSSGGGALAPFVTQTTPGTARNNYTGWVGMKFTVGSQAITVKELGRWVVAGNTQSHPVRLVRVSDNTEVAAADVPTSGAPAGQFTYAALASPVTLAANAAYYVVSYETAGGDFWYDQNSTVTVSSAGTASGAAYGPYTPYLTVSGAAGTSYVPPGFRYETGGGGGTTSSGVRWLVKDQLGTPRMSVDQTGTLTGVRRHDYLPFGEELFAGTGGRTSQQGYSGDAVRQHFTGYERDEETGLDYAQARYYASAMGRFTGADPVSGVVSNPQSWNGYTYTLNNPVNLTDPTGMFANAEYGSDPSREMDPFLDYAKRRAWFTDHMARALAAYEHMVEQGRERLRQKRKKKPQPPPQQPQQPPPPPVVDARKDQIINAQVEQVRRNGRALAAGQTPTLTTIAVIPGATYNVDNATVIDQYGRQTVGGFSGTIQMVAYVPLDQGGNIMPEDQRVGLAEYISVDGDPWQRLPPGTKYLPPPRDLGGVFVDMQLIARGEQPTRVRQIIQMVHPATISNLTFGVNEITKTPPQGRTPGSISITLGQQRRRQ